jgi:gamma-glutamyl-gamma-aminobutyrate hydrolase PuuD
MDITLNIGICVRPDGRGTGHNWDRTSLNAARQLFSKPIRLGREREEIIVKLNAIPVPGEFTGAYDESQKKMVTSPTEPKDPSDMSAVQGARATHLQAERAHLQDTPENRAKARDKVYGPPTSEKLQPKVVAGIDLLYVPGAAAATPTQGSDKFGMQATSGAKGTEANSRDNFERQLIDLAMTVGIPVLAVCAGSWRLLESFGGKVRELNNDEVSKHHLFAVDQTGLSNKALKLATDARKKEVEERYGKDATVWNLDHQLRVHDGPGGVLRSAAERTALQVLDGKTSVKEKQAEVIGRRGKNLVFDGANSTHWAAAAATPSTIDAPGRLAPSQPPVVHPSLLRDPGQLLAVVASDPVTGTVEGFETVHGVPMVGAQWHPEGYLEGQPGTTMSYANSGIVGLSQELFRCMIFAALTARQRRVGVIPAIESGIGLTQLRKVPESEKRYRPAPVDQAD